MRESETEETRTDTRKITIKNETPLWQRKSSDTTSFSAQLADIFPFCPQLSAFL